MKKAMLKVTALFCVLTLLTLPTLSLTVPEYNDVQQDHWAYEYIMKLTSKNIVIGECEYSFKPDGYLNNASLSTMLYRIIGNPNIIEKKYWNNVYFFTDSPYPIKNYQNKWYYKPIQWACQSGITINQVIENHVPTNYWFRDISDNYDYLNFYKLTFAPIDPYTRGDVIMSLYFFAEHMGYDLSESADLSSFKDVGDLDNTTGIQPPNYNNQREFMPMKDYWSWAVGCGIIDGYPDGTLSQNNYVTRAEFAKMLCKFIDYYNVQ